MTNNVIITDYLIAAQSIVILVNSIIHEIQDDLMTCYELGHLTLELQGNEKADQLVKEAATEMSSFTMIITLKRPKN